jgi:hypothetical protein
MRAFFFGLDSGRGIAGGQAANLTASPLIAARNAADY